MKADTLDLTQLFANPVRYLVPIFQRPYVWTQEQHWEPLWEDIKAVAELVAARQVTSETSVATSGVPPHFLGAVVLDQVLNPTGSLQSRYVIDGQQRLTTMQLFLSAASEVAAEKEFAKQFTTLQRLTNNPEDLIDEDVNERFKVWPTMRDREAFIAVMDHNGQISNGDHHASHKLAHAEDFFRARIAEWVTDEESDGENEMRALVGVISRMLKLVVIDLEPDDNAQVIFETLNARGTRLLASDLVKNLVFQRAAVSDADLQALYEEHWKPFDTDHWRKEIRQGRLNRPRVEVFLFHWLVMQTENEVSASRLFQSFKGLVDAGDRTVVDLLGEFSADGDTFEAFDHQPVGSRAQQFFYRLDALDTTTLLPIVLFLRRQPASVLDEAALQRALRVLESWLIRRMVCRMTTRRYNRLFIDFLSAVKANPGEADRILFEMLGELEVDTALWPTDEEFLAALVDQPLYGSLSQKRVRMLLVALEDRLRSAATLSERIPADTALHIEHILPQSWQEHWPLPDGGTPEAKQLRDIAKHQLGNLTLVTNKLNPSMSNGSWVTKKSALDDHSLLMLNRKILQGDPATWDESTITARGQLLGQLALDIWPGAVADFPSAFEA